MEAKKIYRPEIEDTDQELRTRISEVQKKTGRLKGSIASQAMEIGLNVIEKRIEIGLSRCSQ